MNKEVINNQKLKKDLKVLVVEDHYINQELMREMLERFDCEIDGVENGQLAVQKVRDNDYDIIFMDLQMPTMDGFEATRLIREVTKGKRQIPIVALTANAMQSDKVKCLESGMDDYLSKPFELCDIETILKKYGS